MGKKLKKKVFYDGKSRGPLLARAAQIYKMQFVSRNKISKIK